MNALSVGAPLRGVAAFSATLLTIIVCLNILLAIVGVSQFGSWSWSGVTFATLFASFYASPLLLIVPAAMLPIQLSGAARPMADVLLWAIAFAMLMLLLWGPGWYTYFELRDPMSGLEIPVALLCGALSGATYWLFAGRPAPPYDR